MNVNEVAELLGLHVNTVYNYINSGKINAVKKSGSWVISDVEFLKMKRMQMDTPRLIMESLTRVLELVDERSKHIDEMLSRSWNGSKTVDKIKQFEELEATEKQLKLIQSDYQEMVRTGLIDMDKNVNEMLDTDSVIEYRSLSDKDE